MPETQPPETKAIDAMPPVSATELQILDLLKVPPQPQAPDGSPESIRIFHAGRNFYTFRLILWALGSFGFLVLLLVLDFAGTRALLKTPNWIQLAWLALVWFDLIAFAATLPITFLGQRLNYKLRWYIVTDRSLRIRTGIFSMQELTMTYSNIQEIRVTAGPLQNLLGIADVEVQSAGGGSDAKSSGHTGRFEGVSNANEIRDLMVDRLRQYRDSGLGEAAKPHHAAETDAATTEAARYLLDEVRALRLAFEK